MSTSQTPLLRGDPDEARHTYTPESPEAIAEEELTEEELAEYERGIISWRKARRFDFWVRKEWRWGYALGVVAIVGVVLMTVYRHRLIDWLEPIVRDLRKWKVGWLIPIGLIFVLSFPPLFGNEIVILLVGVVWGLPRGIGIVTAGVVLGESAAYAMFRYACRGRAEQMTHKDLSYACLSQAIIEGGFWMATVVRLSIIPTHFTTAVLAICGLRYRHFLAALILGLPKQIIAVYAGTIIAQKHPSTSSKAISDTVFVVTALMTVLAMRFIYKRMTAVRKKVLLAMRNDLRSKGVTVPSASGSTRSEDTIRP